MLAGAKAGNGTTITVDHAKGTLTLWTRQKAPQDACKAEFLKGWPVAGADFELALACRVENVENNGKASELFRIPAGFVDVSCKKTGLDIRQRLATEGQDAGLNWKSRLFVSCT